MKPHEIAAKAGYKNDPRFNFGQVAKRAAELCAAGQNEAEVTAALHTEFGAPTSKLQLRPQPGPYQLFEIEGSPFEKGALDQLKMAMRLPVALRAAAMPDSHQGYSLNIGGVIALDNAVAPSFVGYDIGCRMQLTILAISVEDFIKERAALFGIMQQASRFGTGAEFEKHERRDHVVMENPAWKQVQILSSLKDLAWRQLGTLGSGNHFMELVIGEVVGQAAWMPLPVGERFVALLTHGGSRKTGHDVADHFVKVARKETSQIAEGIPNGYEWLKLGTAAADDYLAAMELMGLYAQANHTLTHEKFLKDSGLGIVGRWENHHNYAWTKEGGEVIHRKGATPAELGLPGIIPGSCGTASYLVDGLGNPDSLWSSSHGAGRTSSRTAAEARFNRDDFERHMLKHDILHVGIVGAENPSAYKDIDQVMAAQCDLVSPIARCFPTCVQMG